MGAQPIVDDVAILLAIAAMMGGIRFHKKGNDEIVILYENGPIFIMITLHVA